MPLEAEQDPEVVRGRDQLFCSLLSKVWSSGKWVTGRGDDTGFEGWLETTGSHPEAAAPTVLGFPVACGPGRCSSAEGVSFGGPTTQNERMEDLCTQRIIGHLALAFVRIRWHLGYERSEARMSELMQKVFIECLSKHLLVRVWENQTKNKWVVLDSELRTREIKERASWAERTIYAGTSGYLVCLGNR